MAYPYLEMVTRSKKFGIIVTCSGEALIVSFELVSISNRKVSSQATLPTQVAESPAIMDLDEFLPTMNVIGAALSKKWIAEAQKLIEILFSILNRT